MGGQKPSRKKMVCRSIMQMQKATLTRSVVICSEIWSPIMKEGGVDGDFSDFHINILNGVAEK